MRLKTIFSALAVAALSVTALANPAFAAGRAFITGAITSVTSFPYAGSSNGIGGEAYGYTTTTFVWYVCETDTDPLSTRNDNWNVSVSDVTESAIASELSDNKCETVGAPNEDMPSYTYFYKDGEFGKDPKKTFVTFTMRVSSEYIAYPVYALADAARLADFTTLPTAVRNGNTITATAGVPLVRPEDLEYYRTDPLNHAWFACDTPRTAGGNIAPNEPLSDCKQLYTGFVDDEGISGVLADDVELDLTSPLYDTYPDNLGEEVPANLAGKHLVYVSISYPMFVWPNSVPFDASSDQVRQKRTVYFDSDSAVLTAAAKKTLRGLVKAFRAAGTVETVRITGFVQPSGSTANDISLSRARAVSVRAYLKQLGVKAAFTIKASGRLKENSAKSRKAVVVISGTAIAG